MNDSSFIRVLYSNKCFILNGIYITVNIIKYELNPPLTNKTNQTNITILYVATISRYKNWLNQARNLSNFQEVIQQNGNP